MKIEYYDKFEKSDPAQQSRGIAIQFDTPEELAALNRRDTYNAILKYTRAAMEAFLKENANAR